jgi:hypothetical protein
MVFAFMRFLEESRDHLHFGGAISCGEFAQLSDVTIHFFCSK